MAEIPRLTLSFLERRPNEAARVLEKLPPDNAAAFLEEVPIDIGGRVLEEIFPEYAALCLPKLSVTKAGALVQAMSAASCVPILRHVPDSVVEKILGQLPASKKNLVAPKLAYPLGTVGAWMESEVPEVPASLNVGDARKYLRRLGRSTTSELYILNEDRTLEGVVPLAKLAIAKDNFPLSKLVLPEFKPLSDRTSLNKVKALEDWEDRGSLPVIDRKGKLIGALTQSGFQKALSHNGSQHDPLDLRKLALDLTETYTTLLFETIGSIMDILVFTKNMKK